jgi:hypothetical protein
MKINEKIQCLRAKLLRYKKRLEIFTLIIFSIAAILPIFLIPAQTAANLTTSSWITIIIAFIPYLIIWLYNFLFMYDTVAYIYGFKRPFIVSPGFNLTFEESSLRTPFDYIKNSLISYVLTLYGFAVAYLFISQLDKKSFNINCSLDYSTSVYFTVVTAATVGYGDIYPVSVTARWFVSAEIIISFLYIIFIFSNIAGFAQISSKNLASKNKDQ